MSDAQLRELERRWQAGDVSAGAAFLAASVRSGSLGPGTLRLRAYLGDPAAQLAFGGDPAPRRVEPAAPLAADLARFVAVGGVVEYAFFEPALDERDRDAHEIVARAAARVSTSVELAGSSADLARFLGRGFDLERRVILFPSPDGYLPAAEAAASRAARGGYGSTLDGGYAYAFADPPYHLNIDLPGTQALFTSIWERAIGSWDPARVVVFEWDTTTLGGFFDAGHEWWGSFLWTVAPPDGRPWIGIAASATD